MNNKIKFSLNRKIYSLTKQIYLYTLIEYLNYQNNFIIIEHNSKLYSKLNTKNILININDKIEIISIAGGG